MSGYATDHNKFQKCNLPLIVIKCQLNNKKKCSGYILTTDYILLIPLRLAYLKDYWIII